MEEAAAAAGDEDMAEAVQAIDGEVEEVAMHRDSEAVATTRSGRT